MYGEDIKDNFLSSSPSLPRILVLLCANIFFFSPFPLCSPCFVSISFRGRKVQRPNGFGDCLLALTIFQALLICSLNFIEFWKSVSFHSVFNATFTKETTFSITKHVSFQNVIKLTKSEHRFFFFILPPRCHTLLILYLLVLFRLPSEKATTPWK